MIQGIRPIPDTEYVLALMQYISMRGDVRLFLNASGKDVARMCATIDNLIESGFVVRENKRLLVTEKGNKYIAALNKQFGRKGLYAKLIPDYSVRREQMNIADTYIPQYLYKRGGGHFSNSYVLGRSGDSSGDNVFTIEHNK